MMVMRCSLDWSLMCIYPEAYEYAPEPLCVIIMTWSDVLHSKHLSHAVGCSLHLWIARTLAI